MKAAQAINYPVMVRAAYALGGLGSGLCENEQRLREVSTQVTLNQDSVLHMRSVFLLLFS